VLACERVQPFEYFAFPSCKLASKPVDSVGDPEEQAHPVVNRKTKYPPVVIAELSRSVCRVPRNDTIVEPDYHLMEIGSRLAWMPRHHHVTHGFVPVLPRSRDTMPRPGASPIGKKKLIESSQSQDGPPNCSLRFPSGGEVLGWTPPDGKKQGRSATKYQMSVNRFAVAAWIVAAIAIALIGVLG
jgi:hypothetical protein